MKKKTQAAAYKVQVKENTVKIFSTSSLSLLLNSCLLPSLHYMRGFFSIVGTWRERYQKIPYPILGFKENVKLSTVPGEAIRSEIRLLYNNFCACLMSTAKVKISIVPYVTVEAAESR
jgi:hypothetical protein